MRGRSAQHIEFRPALLRLLSLSWPELAFASKRACSAGVTRKEGREGFVEGPKDGEGDGDEGAEAYRGAVHPASCGPCGAHGLCASPYPLPPCSLREDEGVN